MKQSTANFIATTLAIVTIVGLESLVVYFAWNWLLIDLISVDVRNISYFESIGIAVLLRLLMNIFRGEKS